MLLSFMLQVVLISPSLQDSFERNKLDARSVACHQFNLVKDKHNIILILVHSNLNSSSGGLMISILFSSIRSRAFPNAFVLPLSFEVVL